MRLTIVAGLIMGVSLAIQSGLDAQARAKVSRAASADRVHESAPWYIATNAGQGAGCVLALTRDNRAGVLARDGFGTLI
jgi:hypothetical protein